MKKFILLACLTLSGSFALAHPLKCDESPYWKKGTYELRITKSKTSKDAVLLALESLHYVGGPFANVKIVRSHSYNDGHVIEFIVAGLETGSSSAEQQRHLELLHDILSSLKNADGLEVMCSYIQPGGVVIHN